MEKRQKTGGRVKGTPNKTTASMKAAIQAVYADLQEKADDKTNSNGHFLEWAVSNPTEFYKLASKLLPIQMTGGDEDDAPIKTELNVRILSDSTLREIASQG